MRVLEHCKQLAPEAMAWTLAAVALCAGIGSYPLSDNNEGLYAAVAAGMLRSGHFLIPRIAGLPYIGKPPLLYWLLAASFAVCGRNALAARLVPAAAALGTCLVLYVLLRGLEWRREANIAVVVFGTCAGAIVLAHVVLFDMVLTLGLTIALAGACVWYVGRGESRLGLRVGAAGLAAAIMTKGLVAAVLLGGTLAVLAWLEPAGGRAWMRRLADPAAIGVLLGLTVPWHLAAALLALVGLAAGAGGQFSDASLARAACARPGGAPLLLYEQPEAVSAALFYCRSRFQVIDSRSGDLWFAQRLHEGIGRIFLDAAQTLRDAGRRGRCLLVPHRDLARFARSPLAALAVPRMRAPTATWFELVGRRRWLLADVRRLGRPLRRRPSRIIRGVAR